ncbi:MAG: hypothetical protein LWW86_04735 [Micrococcales bacterium]|nr:hypothetical protein [Micrococcales bacterium]
MDLPFDSQITCLLCWWPDSLSRMVVADVLTSHPLGFEPTWVQLNYYEGGSREVPFGPAAREALAGDGPMSWKIETERGWEGPSVGHNRTLHVDLVKAGRSLPTSTIEVLAQLDGFTIGLRGDAADHVWQSEKSLGNYRVFGRPYEHLPTYRDRHGRERVDISGNPGRDSETVGLRMWAASDIWFGPEAGRALDYSRIHTIPVGALTELPNDRWHLHLYDLYDPIDEIRRKQSALRAHLDWDRLEAEAPQRVAELRAQRGW